MEIAPLSVVIYHNLARLNSYFEKYDQAKMQFEKAIKISTELEGEDNKDLIEIYHSFSQMYEKQGNAEMHQKYKDMAAEGYKKIE